MKNLKLLSAVIVLIFSAFTFQACNDKDDDDLRMDNHQFVVQASSSNSFEIAAGNLAIKKGESENVKSYGRRMVQDHTIVGLEMDSLADAKGWSIPSELQTKEKANLDKLNAASDTEFDQQFADIMIQSHEDAVELFTMASAKNGVTDSDLRKFAADKLPALKKHLEDALTLKTQVND